MPSGSAEPRRVDAVDAMRGFVIALMAVDHAQGIYNPDHLMADSASQYRPGLELPAAEFVTRWITHLCAPTFLFLAGTAIALSVAAQRARGVAESRIDRHLALRGLFVLALDPLLIRHLWQMDAWLLQVLYALGGSMLAMVLLRRLPSWLLFGLGLATLGTHELWAGPIRFAGDPPLADVLLGSGGFAGGIFCLYPLAPWLAMLLLGVPLGRCLARGQRDPVPLLLAGGTGALLLFLLLRAIDGYGNLHLHRDGSSWIRWLHVSKYPPSLTFAALELGLMALLLAWWLRREARGRLGSARHPLLLFGRTALFFYLAHFLLLGAGAIATNSFRQLSLGWAWGIAALALLLLYPVCAAYDRFKRTHRNWLTRLV